MRHGGGLVSFMSSDNGLRLERSEWNLGPDWFLPNVPWIVLSDFDLAFLNHEDPKFIAATKGKQA